MTKNNKHLAYIFVLLFLASPVSAFAHPGNTAADGCHYCRTNCDKWGVPWNERHCHGGGIEAVETSVAPTTPPTRIPTRIPTKIPTLTPTPTKSEPTPTVSVPTNTPIPANTSTQSQVLGSTTSTTNNSSNNPLGGIAIFAWLVYGIVKLAKRFKKTKENSS